MQQRPIILSVFGVGFALLLSASLALSLCAYNIEKQVFNPEVYKQALVEQNFCQRLPVILTAQFEQYIQSRTDEPLLGLIFGSLDTQTTQSLITTLLPCEVVQDAMFQGIDIVFDFINTQTAPSQLSMETLKGALSAQSGKVVDNFYESLPPCTTDEILLLGSGLLTGDSSEIQLCKPPDMFKEVITMPLQGILSSFIEGLPGQVQLFDVEKIGIQFRIMRLILHWSFIWPVLFLVGLSLCVVRKWRDILLWWGVPILLGGMMALVASVLAAPVTEIFLRNLILPMLTVNLVPEAMQLIADIIAEVASGVTAPIVKQALLFSLVGAGLVGTEFFLRLTSRYNTL